MSKFIKALIISNGLLIPCFILFLTFEMLKNRNYYPEEPESIIVGEELEDALKDSLMLQGISYEYPLDIHNTDNQYMPVSALTYEEARHVKLMTQSAGDMPMGSFNHINILFLDKDYRIIGRLLEKRGSIVEIQTSPLHYYNSDEGQDTTFRHLTYLIGFNDTNNDNKLDYQDDHDLYISDLNGKNLTQVTTGKTVIEYQWLAGHKQIFIGYKDRNGLRDEYNPKKFALYDVKSRTFEELKDIHNSLKDIERMLLK